jgi:hypothetical protein
MFSYFKSLSTYKADSTASTALAYIFNKEVSLVYNFDLSANALTESAINKIRMVFIF